MTQVVTITEVETGREAVYRDGQHWTSGFIWREGNYSCDCNRELFFRRALGLPEVDPACGEGRFHVVVRSDAGVELYRDDRPATAGPIRESEG